MVNPYCQNIEIPEPPVSETTQQCMLGFGWVRHGDYIDKDQVKTKKTAPKAMQQAYRKSNATIL
jgi:hypothetical protein